VKGGLASILRVKDLQRIITIVSESSHALSVEEAPLWLVSLSGQAPFRSLRSQNGFSILIFNSSLVGGFPMCSCAIAKRSLRFNWVSWCSCSISIDPQRRGSGLGKRTKSAACLSCSLSQLLNFASFGVIEKLGIVCVLIGDYKLYNNKMRHWLTHCVVIF